MGSVGTRRCPATLASLRPRRANLKRATVFLLGFFLLCLPLLCVGPSAPSLNGNPQGASAARPYDAQSGKAPLTLQNVIHPASVIAPGITALSWRPGGRQ